MRRIALAFAVAAFWLPLPAAAGHDRFSASPRVFPEAGGAVRITVSIGCTNPIHVFYRTQGQTAEPGVDYTEVSGNFTISRSTPQTFDLPVIDDGFAEDDETLHLFLEGGGGTGGGGTDSEGVCVKVPDADILLTIHDEGDPAPEAPAPRPTSVASSPTEGEGETGNTGRGTDLGGGPPSDGDEPVSSDEEETQTQSEKPAPEIVRAQESAEPPGVSAFDLIFGVLAGLVLGGTGIWYWLRRRAAR